MKEERTEDEEVRFYKWLNEQTDEEINDILVMETGQGLSPFQRQFGLPRPLTPNNCRLS